MDSEHFDQDTHNGSDEGELLTDLEDLYEEVLSNKGRKLDSGKAKEVRLSTPSEPRNLSTRKEEKMLGGFHKEDRRSIEAARKEKVVFNGFSLRRSVDAAHGGAPLPVNSIPVLETEWLDDTPRLAVDRDDIPIVLHIPNWQGAKSLDFLNGVCMELSKAMPPTFGDGADKKWRNCEKTYRRVEGQLRGRINLVTAWHAIGHPNEAPVPSSSMIGSGKKFAASMKAFDDLKVVAKRLNKVLELLDPVAALQYEKLLETAERKLPHFRALRSVDPSYWQGRAILFNSLTPPHRDSKNPPAEWTPLHAAGDFTTGGPLYVEELNLYIRYLPGDLILLRGRALKHSVKPWKGGQRISIAYFTHESMWKSFDLRLSL